MRTHTTHMCVHLYPQYAKIVQKLGFPATFKEFKVQNIVGSCDVRFPIRLEGLAFGHQLFSNVRGCALALCDMYRGYPQAAFLGLVIAVCAHTRTCLHAPLESCCGHG